ncbi:lipoyltransferase [Hortaea werneckii]|nr:lipoyltransferase [Hortaea werneckii]KAI7068385.1 lipoyltransferase [Hortaea werneckii]KAI7222987.1 lipoyltransferase [Hortaea werneckii]KAI7299493.1 lipoyltransferase [Hortaea werneckii]
MILRHLHIPGLTPYAYASKLQDLLVARLLAHKANPALPAPDPTIITAQFHPVYTCGRREIGSVSDEQREYLTQSTQWGKAEFREAMRGGQTTFHGPGQVVAYPILDLRRHGISPRCWVDKLEDTVIKTCAEYGVQTRRTENPGVWVNEQEKICALGVHLRRNVTSHGIGLNVDPELGWFGRIVACGLQGKSTTSLAQQGVKPLPSVEDVGKVFARTLAEGIKDIEAIAEIDENAID